MWHGSRGWPARVARMAGGGGDVRRAAIRALPTKQSKTVCFGFWNPEVLIFEVFIPGCYKCQSQIFFACNVNCSPV